ncbi:hypothetical protein [Luteimonas sp. 3794]|uniref:hypothetical protein n=1 Tax=Luteimonas sp. 3794 TaxID=2817730 RepID=UPI00286406F2|nr:hypothetical protein [Luteimonas sp. 3794]MDR6989991.1 hypothetical protein [Luteimonas sp. 3794]
MDMMKARERRTAALHVQAFARDRDEARCGVKILLNSARGIGTIPSPLRAHRVLLVSLALALAACAPASNPAAPPVAVTNPAPAATCPSESFDAFIERFGREIAFQELATSDPLVIERYDIAAEPEPRRVVQEIALADVVWPVMPRLDLMSGRGRVYDIAPTAENRMEVQIRTPDTSDQQRYVFGQSPCWQLQRVVDESI